MNPVQTLFNQQYGYRTNRTIEPYLSRLRCLKKEDYSQIHQITDYQDTPIFACKFSDKKGYEDVLALANEDGILSVLNVNKNEDRISLRAHNNAIFDLTWLFGQLKIVTASGDHTCKLYNISNEGITEERSFFRHERSVKSVAPSKNDPSIFATGGRDGNIILWDIRANNTCTSLIAKSDKIIGKSHISKPMTPTRKNNYLNANQNKSVTGLVFQNSNTLISCGAGDGCVKVWDLRKTHYNSKKDPLPKYMLQYPGKSTKNGYSNLIIDSESLKLYANCLDNNIYCFNIGTYDDNPIMTYTGHQNNSFYIKSALSNDNSFLISGSSDENAYIWNLKHNEPICKLVGHLAEVTCVAWCNTFEPLIVTCSDDIRHKIWRIGVEDFREPEHEIGGKTEILHIPKITNKRQINIDTFNIIKKHVKSCSKCSSPTHSSICNNCIKTNKRKLVISEESLKYKKIQTNLEPRELFKQNENKRKYEEILKDLPNFVIDGVAPHLNFSPPKKKHCDWLTKIRIEQNFKKQVLDKYETQIETPPKPKTNSKIKQSHLLKYFKLTNVAKCDKHQNLFKNCNNFGSNDT